MSKRAKFNVAFIIVFSIVIAWRNYVVVIGQTVKPEIVTLGKNDATVTEKVETGRMADGDAVAGV